MLLTQLYFKQYSIDQRAMIKTVVFTDANTLEARFFSDTMRADVVSQGVCLDGLYIQ